ncbi:MAG: peptidase C45 [Actinobacteria bacterium]|nr:peptidase C45 [Actinomycetota bacterium]
MYPRIRVSGPPRERGRQYGEGARERIAACRDGYAEVYADVAGLSWAQAREAGAVYLDPIAAHAPEALEEMRGIAEGAGLELADVLAINARTEIIWAATAKQAAVERAGLPVARECTSFALLGRRTEDGQLLIGENWDWLVLGFDTVVVLEVERDDEKPNFVTVVEAGLLCKASLNSAGLAVATNALVTGRDRGEPGLPFHVMLRLLADQETVTDAIDMVQRAPRASSANYLLGHADDVAVNLETAPGGFREVSWQLPTDGVLVHTNHFIELPPGLEEVSIYAMPDSIVRYGRTTDRLGEPGTRWGIESLRAALTDHADRPSSVCCHPDPREPRTRQWATVMSVIFEPAARAAWLASGNPCENEFEPLDCGSLLDKPVSI